MGKHFTEKQEIEIYNTFLKFGKNQAISLMYKYGSKAKSDSINKRFRKM
ncbi:hypothetical protein [Mycoplasma seminis]|uniref:Uncharacterized protein n=1 Tax=Mycoplasma seminis TaxID=512749 RepID=A0ABY9HBJ6_9MOLU|nr:hypothetical protein [Mycoplasma seminis]WLP85939.1 hypothetical protein Q8852_02230 [Mycoplasma seminis]